MNRDDEIDKTWDRADFAADSVWQEMDKFLRRCEADGPPKSAAETRERKAQFIEISSRCHARASEIYERASAGNPAPHLSICKKVE